VRQRRLRDFIPTQSIERKSVVSSRLSLIRRSDRRRSEAIEILRGLIERVAVSAAEGGFTATSMGYNTSDYLAIAVARNEPKILDQDMTPGDIVAARLSLSERAGKVIPARCR
jgi:hypothetical protein